MCLYVCRGVITHAPAAAKCDIINGFVNISQGG